MHSNSCNTKEDFPKKETHVNFQMGQQKVIHGCTEFSTDHADYITCADVVGKWTCLEPKEVHLPTTSTLLTTMAWMTENLHRHYDMSAGMNYVQTCQRTLWQSIQTQRMDM